MITEPYLEYRAMQHYAGIHSHVSMKNIPDVLPPLIPQVHTWLEKHSIKPIGPPFFRYLKMDAMESLDADVGFPVPDVIQADEPVHHGIIPAGTYAVCTYMGHYNGLMKAHMAMDDWAKKNNIEWSVQKTEGGILLDARIEFYPTDPNTEPDPDKWRTDIAYMIADNLSNRTAGYIKSVVESR